MGFLKCFSAELYVCPVIKIRGKFEAQIKRVKQHEGWAPALFFALVWYAPKVFHEYESQPCNSNQDHGRRVINVASDSSEIS